MFCKASIRKPSAAAICFMGMCARNSEGIEHSEEILAAFSLLQLNCEDLEGNNSPGFLKSMAAKESLKSQNNVGMN